ncbi:MAG: isoprenyl transferase [Rhodospirillaceae bacterium]
MALIPTNLGEHAAPRHVAIIMDGNGRWAQRRGLPRAAGHKAGADAVSRAIRGAGDLGIPYLTLFGFSSENWQRPKQEVTDLMGLLRLYLRSEIAGLNREGVRLRVIGERDQFDQDIVDLIADAERLTAENDRLNLTVALSYGGRREIVEAARQVAAKVAAGAMRLEDIDEKGFARLLYTDGLPEPDLVIRTSGEQRISNFLLWQMAYAEFSFIDVLWPDFDEGHLAEAVSDFLGRDRRFGGAVSA